MIIQGNVCSHLYRYAAADADVMLCDPPYSPRVHSKATSAGTGGRGVQKRDLGFGHLTPELQARISLYAAQVKRWTVVFTDVESVSSWIGAMQSQGVEYVRTIPWVRWSQPQLSGDRPPTGAECICLFHRAKGVTRRGKILPMQKRWNGPGNRVAYRAEELDAEPVARAEYTAKSLRGKDKYSCEKPLDLMLALVSDYSDPGELVFDGTCGMGTTLLAARLLDREAFGVERDADVARVAANRLAIPFAIAGGRLAERDEERACRWILETREEALRTPRPRKISEQKTWERAQRRLGDVERLIKYGQR